MPNYEIASIYLKRGEPLPIDVVFNLLAEGIDVSELESSFS